MMTFDNWYNFLLIVLVLTITPGTPRAVIVVYSIKYGFKKSLWTALGDISANTLQIILVISTLGVLEQHFMKIFVYFKWAAVVYILWLGIKFFYADRTKKKQESVGGTIDVGKISLFRDGFVVAGLSPKAWGFFLIFLPQFIDYNSSIILQSVIVILTYTITDFTTLCFYAAGSNFISRLFVRSERTINVISGIVFILLAFWIIMKV